MKKLFCTVVTDRDGMFDSPIIYHTRTDDRTKIDVHLREEFKGLGFSPEEWDERLDVFTFEVRDLDIQEL